MVRKEKPKNLYNMMAAKSKVYIKDRVITKKDGDNKAEDLPDDVPEHSGASASGNKRRCSRPNKQKKENQEDGERIGMKGLLDLFLSLQSKKKNLVLTTRHTSHGIHASSRQYRRF